MAALRSVFLLLLPTLNAAADTVILREKFDGIADGRLPAGWAADGPHWRTQNGRLRGDSLSGEATILFGESDWRNVALAADVTFVAAKDDARWVALLIREGGPGRPGVQLTVRRDAKRRNGLELAARNPKKGGSAWRVFQTAAANGGFLDGRSHRLRIEARGDWIRAFFDNQKVFECPRGPDVQPAGRVGFRISGATVTIDNVEVQEIDPMSTTALRKLRSRPLVIAHRGFSSRAPENTLAAYRLAIDTGADLAECDVWLSADRVPVLLHDEHLKRTTGVDALVSELSLDKLRQLDVGRWKSKEFVGERIPTLTEALELVKGRLRLVIEVKTAGMEQEVVAAIRAAATEPADVMIFSFHLEVIETIARIEPRLPTTWLIGHLPAGHAARREVIADAVRARASAIGLTRTRVDPAAARLAHESGLPVFVWTVNDPADMRYLVRIGVDGIITDEPGMLLRILDE